MPTANKVSWAGLKVGLLAIAALVLLGILIFLLTGNTKLFGSEAHLYTYLDDATGIAKGVPVRLNGILIGKVNTLGLSGDRRPGRVVRIDMEVDRDKLGYIPVNSTVEVDAENLLGTKFLNIHQGTSNQTVQAGGEVKAAGTPDINQVVKQSSDMLVQAQAILQRIDNIVGFIENGQGSIGKLIKDEELYNRIIAITGQVQQLANQLNSNKGTLGKLIYDDTLYTDVRATIGRVDAIIADLQAGKGTAGKLLHDEAVYNEAQANLVQLRQILTDLNAGKGTAGRLLKSDELANEINVTLGKVNTTIDKINSGQGTIGQLMVNQALYDNVNGTVTEMHALLKDFRANPKKFLRIKLGLF